MTNILHTAKTGMFTNVLMRNDRNVIVNFKAGEYIRKMFLSHSVTGRSKEKL